MERAEANHTFSKRMKLNSITLISTTMKIYLNFEIYPETFSTQQGGDFKAQKKLILRL